MHYIDLLLFQNKQYALSGLFSRCPMFTTDWFVCRRPSVKERADSFQEEINFPVYFACVIPQ